MSQASSTVDLRTGGLRRFAIAITFLNVLGHTWLGFEGAWLHPFVGVGAAYAMELLIELMESMSQRRRPAFLGPGATPIDFLLSAHITGMACSMLLYSNERLAPVAFASAVAIASKHLFRVTVGGRARHFLNPSNFGITVTLVLFPWVGIAPPYMFTESLTGLGDWLLPALIVGTGTFLNARFTRKLPLIAAWVGGYAAQGLVRTALLGAPLEATWAPMTGVAFVLFTFYMVTDPGTTPFTRRGQIQFGLAVAAAYGILVGMHVVFGMFFGLTAVCALRGIGLGAQSWLRERRGVDAPIDAAARPAVAWRQVL